MKAPGRIVVGLLFAIALLGSTRPTSASEEYPLYLIIQGFASGCDDATHSLFWYSMKESIIEAFGGADEFDGITCATTLTDEANAVAGIKAKHGGGGGEHDLAHVTIVSALVQSSHCNGSPADCEYPLGSNDGSGYKESLLAGATHVWIETGPAGDLESTLGLASGPLRERVSTITLTPNNYDGGERAGAEFCELSSSSRPIRIAVFFGESTAENSDQRMAGFKDHVAGNCPQHTVVFEDHADWSFDKARTMAGSLFLRDTSVTAVVAANDNMALGAVMGARDARPGGNTGVLVFGYDHIEDVRPFLDRGEVACSIDQVVSDPDDGLVYAIKATVGQLNALKSSDYDGGKLLLSTADINTRMGLGDADKIETATQAYVSDMQMFVTRRIMTNYQSDSRPVMYLGESQAVTVRVGFDALSITDFDFESGVLSSVGWLTSSWNDQRLEWPPKLWESYLRIESASIWMPLLYIYNAKEFQTVFEPMPTLGYVGTVERSQQISMQSQCDTSRGLRMFPFDRHECSIIVRVTSSPEAVALQAMAWDIGSLAESQLAGWTLSIPSAATWVSAPNATDGYQAASGAILNSDSLTFSIGLQRRWERIVFTVLVPAFFINLIGFSSFWLEGYTDSVLIGPLAFLGLMTLHSSDTTNVRAATLTYFDFFYLFSAAFHILCFLIEMRDAAWWRDATSETRVVLSRYNTKHNNAIHDGKVAPTEGQVGSGALGRATHINVDDVLGCKVLVPTFAAKYYMAVLGGIGTSHEDSYGRRVVMPLFFTVNMLLSIGAFSDVEIKVWDITTFTFSMIGLGVWAIAYAMMIFGIIEGISISKKCIPDITHGA